mgnify:CR=1 FL=1
MASAKYRTPEYRAAKRDADAAQARGEWLTCCETICLKSTRDIAPTDDVDIAHDEAGIVVLGPAHAHCNRSEGATRGHRIRAGRDDTRWIL